MIIPTSSPLKISDVIKGDCMNRIFPALMILCLFISSGCLRQDRSSVGPIHYRMPAEYNLKLVVFNDNISSPENDRRTYYRVFIDKIEEGRTTTGLESQQKFFHASINRNRHLLVLEKWVLDEREGRYTKLNNIEQPKPNFFYFVIPEDRVVVITVRSGKDGSAYYSVDFERKP